MGDKALRSWLASLIFLSLVVGLIAFLTFLTIPEKNKDIVTSIIGMLVGSISMAISIFVGRDPDDVAHLKEEIEKLNDDRNTLIARLRDAQVDKDILRRQLEGLQAMVIERLSMFAGDHRLADLAQLKNPDLPDEVARWIPREQLPPRVTPPPGAPQPQAAPQHTPLPRGAFDDILGGDNDR